MKSFLVLKWQFKVKIDMIFYFKNYTSDLNSGNYKQNINIYEGKECVFL